MMGCDAVERSMLPNPTNVHIEGREIDFVDARLIANEKAKELAEHPMLLGWYDSTNGFFSPNVTCCSEHKPGWLVYAESRGGNITITINTDQFIFVYGDLM